MKTNQKAEIVIKKQGRLSAEEVNHMLEQAEKYKKQDKKNAEILDWRNSLENKAWNMKSEIESGRAAQFISEEDKAKINQLAGQAINWLDSHDKLEISLADLKEKMGNLESVYNPIITAAYKNIGHESVPNSDEAHEGKEHQEHPTGH